MNRSLLAALALALLTALGAAAQESQGPGPSPSPEGASLSAEEIVARYVAARGGAERWAGVRTLRAIGSYSAFSFKNDFTLIRARGDLYRLDFEMLQAPAVRARDAEGVWALDKLLWPEPTRVGDTPYAPQLERDAVFGSLLFNYEEREVTIALIGPGDIDGIATLGLAVTLPDGREETWHLDAETYLEVAVEMEVVDFTQASEPVHQRTFFDDFRPVDGLVLPHWVEQEFNHRLESMTIEHWEVNPELAAESFTPARTSPSTD